MKVEGLRVETRECLSLSLNNSRVGYTQARFGLTG